MRKAAHHLEQRRQGWYAVLDVPATLRPVVGQRRLRRTLHTRDLATALRERDRALAELQAQLAEAAKKANATGLADRLAAKVATLPPDTFQVIGHTQQEPQPAVAMHRVSVRSIRVFDSEAAPKATTFRQAAEAYMEVHRPTWKNAVHVKQWESTLETYAYPVIGDLPASAVTTDHVERILKPLWLEKNETASRLRGRLENVLDYAATRGWRSGENPARWKGHLQHILPHQAKVQQRGHHAALAWQQTPAFMQGLEKQDTTAALALRFTILTAARTGEVIGAQWAEIDLENKVWTVPAGRMKAKKEHRVPLSPEAVAVLKEMQRRRLPRHGEWVFPGRYKDGLSNMAMAKVLNEKMGQPDLTVHGFRSTFRDWAAEATSYPREVPEAALAHTIESKVEAAYRRGDLFEKRRKMMDDWATFCAGTAPAE